MIKFLSRSPLRYKFKKVIQPCTLLAPQTFGKRLLSSFFDKNDPLVAEGYNVVLKRCAGIVKSLADNNIAKVLHVYPEGDLLHYLEKVRKLDFSGCSDQIEKEDNDRNFNNIEKYSKIEYLDFKETKTLDYNAASHHLIISLCPPNYSVEQFKYNPFTLEEMSRILFDRGFMILGVSETLFTDLKYMEYISSKCEACGIELLSAQMVTYNESAGYYLLVARKINNSQGQSKIV